MTIKELANKPEFKLFMSRLYGWGASLVILGALFKKSRNFNLFNGQIFFK